MKMVTKLPKLLVSSLPKLLLENLKLLPRNEQSLCSTKYGTTWWFIRKSRKASSYLCDLRWHLTLLFLHPLRMVRSMSLTPSWMSLKNLGWGWHWKHQVPRLATHLCHTSSRSWYGYQGSLFSLRTRPSIHDLKFLCPALPDHKKDSMDKMSTFYGNRLDDWCEGFIVLDVCTSVSYKVNCIVVEDWLSLIVDIHLSSLNIDILQPNY